MKLPAQVDGLDRLELPPRPVHLAIGMFDGVHLGHRAVVDAAVLGARVDHDPVRQPAERGVDGPRLVTGRK